MRVRRVARLFIFVLLAATLAVTGCGKKTPAAAPSSTPAPAPATPAVPPPPPPPPLPAAVPDTDPFAGDLDSVNEYVRRQGLLVDVYFDYDQAELRSDARDRLAKNARFLNERPEFVVAIEGHCDERGTVEYNLGLGDRRADSTRSYLSSIGVDGSRLRAISYGKERPECVDPVEDCWQRNRRARFVIVGRRTSE